MYEKQWQEGRYALQHGIIPFAENCGCEPTDECEVDPEKLGCRRGDFNNVIKRSADISAE